jgi:hypothetical protein
LVAPEDDTVYSKNDKPPKVAFTSCMVDWKFRSFSMPLVSTNPEIVYFGARIHGLGQFDTTISGFVETRGIEKLLNFQSTIQSSHITPTPGSSKVQLIATGLLIYEKPRSAKMDIR